MSFTKRLQRSVQNRFIGGVCAGIGEYLWIDPVWVRLLFVLMVFACGSGILLYVILWIVMPSGSKAYYESLMREHRMKGGEHDEMSEATEQLQTNNATVQFVIGMIFIISGLVFLGLLFLPRFNFIDLCFAGLLVLGIFLTATSFKSKK